MSKFVNKANFTGKETTKELFYLTVGGVLGQWKRCSRDGCAYRIVGDEGTTACAVGYMIDDEVLEKYDQLEDASIHAKPVQAALAESIHRELTEEEVRLFSDLQEAHDSANNPRTMEDVRVEMKFSDNDDQEMYRFIKQAHRIAIEYGFEDSLFEGA